jgi:flagella basal body P-ring formation protein FlgA
MVLLVALGSPAWAELPPMAGVRAAVERALAAKGMTAGDALADEPFVLPLADAPTCPAYEVTETAWNGALQLMEFRLRCPAYPGRPAWLVRAKARDARLARRFERVREKQPPRRRGSSSPRLVRAGQVVSMVSVRQGMRLTDLGRSLDSGGLGDQVRIRNSVTGRVTRGSVIASQTVALEPMP